jgi:hypothetical protein
MEQFVVLCLMGAGSYDETHPERVKQLEFHWNAVSWGVFDRLIGQKTMEEKGWKLLWNLLTLKRDRMFVGVRRALKRMLQRGWITRTEVSLHPHGTIALYAPTATLVASLR